MTKANNTSYNFIVDLPSVISSSDFQKASLFFSTCSFT
ncbi:unnamed protein product [Tenebrio molitor]|nr:unnamed protein product [Tenebrio molitor]